MHILTKARILVTSFASNRVLTASTVTVCGVLRGVHRQENMGETAKMGVLRRLDNIVKSDGDNRNYRALELNNHMKVFLVSDPTTDKSAAAMDVNIGFLSDPDHLPGLAHYCEHMLFLGTKKYPSENDYTKFLTQHGGSSNAYTQADHTNYYFDVVPEHLKDALDRFAQFFISPLFTESATEREINAVDSEHEKNVQNDLWRLDQFDKHTSDPSHPYHKFGTGNKKTLYEIPKANGINVRDELLKFHDTWYSANIMGLAVMGKESLDELEEIVVELFSEVKDKNVTAPKWEEHPFKVENMRTCAYIVPVKDARNLNLVFPAIDLQQYYKASPGHYVSHLIGHEGPGSILSALKARGWSNNLIAGYRPSARGFSFFSISVDLTEEGLKHVDDIIKLIFQYINLLKKDKPFKWIQEEQKDICSMVFRFKDKESPRGYISGVVHNLHDYPLEEVLCANYLLTDWRPDIIEKILDDLVPEKVRVAVTAKRFESETDQTEPWYGLRYRLEKIAPETLEIWKNAGLNNEFHFPEKNAFIPTNFDLYPLEEDHSEYPRIIHDTALSRLWYKQDDKFLLPKADLLFDFVSPMAYFDPLNCNLTHMFVHLFRDALNEYAYAAEIAGLKWNLTNTKYGLILSVSGYNDKHHIFLDKVMERLTNFKVNPKRFAIYKESYIRQLKNFAAEQPYQHAVYHLAVLLTEHSWTKQELLAAAEQLTPELLEVFLPQMLSKMHIECLMHGNINKERALKLVNIVESHMQSTVTISPLLPRQLLLNRELKLEDGCNYVYEVNNGVHKSSCIELYYQCGLQSTENNMLLELIAQIVEEPCYDKLRTQEQLGYIVFSGIRRSNGVQGLRVIIQSEKHPTYLDGRIEEFLSDMLTRIESMSDEEFTRHKDALAAQRLEKPKQQRAQTTIYWMEITAQQYHFDRANVEVAYLKTLTKKDVISFYEGMLKANSVVRRKIGVHVVSTFEGGAGTDVAKDYDVTKDGSRNLIEDVTVFKSVHEMHPLVQPYIEITRKGNKCKL